MAGFYDFGEILRVLEGFNPWWSDRPSQAPPFHRQAFEICRQHLIDPELRRAVLLSGPRRVGKSTILVQLAQWCVEVEKREPRSVFYISLDHPLLKLLSLTEILRLYHDTIYPEGKPVVLLMDEVQYAQEWELHVKTLVDHHPNYRILATGSASVVHRQQLAESGVGRWIRVPVPTLSFYEFLRIRDEEAPKLSAKLLPRDLFGQSKRDLMAIATQLRAVQPAFLRYLLVGGFPETARRSEISSCQRLLREDVVERVLKRDMTALFNVRNVNALERLFIYLCLHTGGMFEVQVCAQALQLSRPTVDNYLELLEQANLIYRLSPTEVGGKKTLRARNKVYLVDAALRNAVLLRGEEILSDSTEMGVIVETTVLRHLIAFHYRDTPRITYWREKRGEREVDVVVQSPSYTLPVEVKYRNSAKLDADSGIVSFCRSESPACAYMVTKTDDDFDIQNVDGVATKIMRIPAHIFCYLLGQGDRAG